MSVYDSKTNGSTGIVMSGLQYKRHLSFWPRDKKNIREHHRSPSNDTLYFKIGILILILATTKKEILIAEPILLLAKQPAYE